MWPGGAEPFTEPIFIWKPIGTHDGAIQLKIEMIALAAEVAYEVYIFKVYIQEIMSYLIAHQWRYIVAQIWVNIGSGNGLLSDGTKPSLEQVMT